MRTAREVFEYIAKILNNDAEDGMMSITTDDKIIEYLIKWQSESLCTACAYRDKPGCRIANLGVAGIIKKCPKWVPEYG